MQEPRGDCSDTRSAESAKKSHQCRNPERSREKVTQFEFVSIRRLHWVWGVFFFTHDAGLQTERRAPKREAWCSVQTIYTTQIKLWPFTYTWQAVLQGSAAIGDKDPRGTTSWAAIVANISLRKTEDEFRTHRASVYDLEHSTMTVSSHNKKRQKWTRFYVLANLIRSVRKLVLLPIITHRDSLLIAAPCFGWIYHELLCGGCEGTYHSGAS